MVEIGEVDLYQQIGQQIPLHKRERATNGDNQPTRRNQLASQPVVEIQAVFPTSTAWYLVYRSKSTVLGKIKELKGWLGVE